MDMTINLGDAGLILIGLAVLVLLIYIIIVVKNFIPVVRSLNKILDDVQVISGITAENAKDLDKIVGDVSSSVSNIASSIKGNQSFIAALSSLINALGSLNSLLRKDKN